MIIISKAQQQPLQPLLGSNKNETRESFFPFLLQLLYEEVVAHVLFQALSLMRSFLSSQ